MNHCQTTVRFRNSLACGQSFDLRLKIDGSRINFEIVSEKFYVSYALHLIVTQSHLSLVK